MGSERRGMAKRGQLARERKELDRAIAKVLANALRNQILAILNERRGSATQLAKELKLDFAEVQYEMEALKKAELIEKVGERRRGNSMEIFYIATARAYINPEQWLTVADPIKAGLRASAFQNVIVDAATAISEETYDSLEGAHLSWSPMIVDEQGWKELTKLLLQTMDDSLKIQEESASRLMACDEEGVSVTAAILGFPSANLKRKIGLPPDADQMVDLTKLKPSKRMRSSKSMRSKQKDDRSKD